MVNLAPGAGCCSNLPTPRDAHAPDDNSFIFATKHKYKYLQYTPNLFFCCLVAQGNFNIIILPSN